MFRRLFSYVAGEFFKGVGTLSYCRAGLAKGGQHTGHPAVS